MSTVPLSDVIGAAAESGVVDSTMEQRLAEHLPADSVFGESVAGSLNTPQVQQARGPLPRSLRAPRSPWT